MSNELLDCPFCGQPDRAQHLPTCWFLLRDLGASRARLAQAWNRRVTPAKQPAKVAMTVDTPEFRELLAWVVRDVGDPQKSFHMRNLIAHIDAWAARSNEDAQEGERLDWLEQMGNEPEGLLLHDGGDFTGRRGLGLRRIGRTRREAVDAARRKD